MSPFTITRGAMGIYKKKGGGKKANQYRDKISRKNGQTVNESYETIG